jgi:hypothetical protein
MHLVDLSPVEDELRAVSIPQVITLVLQTTITGSNARTQKESTTKVTITMNHHKPSCHICICAFHSHWLGSSKLLRSIWAIPEHP